MVRAALFAAFVASILLTGCASVSEPQKQDTATIAATLALSGNYAFIGQNELHGLELGVKHVNENGGINGKKLILVADDNAGDAKTGLATVQKFFETSNPDVVFSAFTHITVAVNGTVLEHKKPLVYASSVPDMARASPYAFRDYFDAGDNGAATADIALKQNYKRVAYLGEQSEVCNLFEKAFTDRASTLGITITNKQNFVSSETDFRTSILKLDLPHVDALITCTWRSEGLVTKQISELNLLSTPSIHFIAPFFPAGDTPEVRSLYEQNKLISTWYGSSAPINDVARAFYKAHYDAYGTEPRADSLYTYDDVLAIAAALRTCDNKGLLHDSECFVTEFAKTNTNGVSGPLSFDKDGLSQRAVFAMQVKNGNWTEYSLQ